MRARSGQVPVFFWVTLISCALLSLALATCKVIPHVVNARIDAEERVLFGIDRAPPAPLRIGDTIGIVIHGAGRFNGAGAFCESLCQQLLLTGATRSVITAPSLSGAQATRWTVVDRDLPCTLPQFPDDAGHIWSQLGPVQSELADMSVAGSCIVPRPAALAEAPDILELHILGVETSSAQYDDLHPPFVGQQLSLWRRDENGRLALAGRATWRLPRKLTPWLHREGNGSVNSPRLQWARLEDPGRESPNDPAVALTSFLAFEPESVGPADPPALRRAIDAWLNTTDAPSPELVSHIHSSMYRALAAETRQPEDFSLSLRLLRDCRFYPGLAQQVASRYPDRIVEIRNVLVDRMMSDAPGAAGDCNADETLAALPDGAFATLSPAIVQLVKGREWAPQLRQTIARLSEAGPDIAPLLLKLLDDNSFRTRGEFDEANSVARDAVAPDSRVAEAAIDGLCAIDNLRPVHIAHLRRVFVANPDLSGASASCQYRPPT